MKKIVLFALILTVLIAGVYAATFITNSEFNFNEGIYNRTFYNTSFVQLNSTYNNGTYESKVFDASSNSSWDNISWTQNINVSYSPEILTNYTTGYDADREIKSNDNWGQTYVYNGTGKYYVTNISLYIKKDSGASKTIYVYIRSSWNGANLGSDSISSDSLGTSPAWYNFNFSDIELDKDSTYYIRTNSTGTGKVYLGVDASSATYANGDLIKNSGSPDTGRDALFKVYGFNTFNLSLNLTARSCNDANCLGENWIDITDESPQNLNVSNNRYFQYKAYFETEDVDYSPLLYNVTVGYTELDTEPPATITNLTSQSAVTWIYWTWINPNDADFDHTELYLDNIWVANTSNEVYNATGLTENTSYTLSTRTVDINNNINTSWVNNTATTDALIFCGDGSCNGAEDCSSCPIDCGVCSSSGGETSSSGEGRGDGHSSGYYNEPEAPIEPEVSIINEILPRVVVEEQPEETIEEADTEIAGAAVRETDSYYKLGTYSMLGMFIFVFAMIGLFAYMNKKGIMFRP